MHLDIKTVLDVAKYWLRPRLVFSGESVKIDPLQNGLLVGREETLLPWGEIKELRRYKDVSKINERWYGHHRIFTNIGKIIWFDLLPESIEKLIIEKAQLNDKRISFWTSEEIYRRSIKRNNSQ